eukprot:GSA25T00019239001.1
MLSSSSVKTSNSTASTSSSTTTLVKEEAPLGEVNQESEQNKDEVTNKTTSRTSTGASTPCSSKDVVDRPPQKTTSCPLVLANIAVSSGDLQSHAGLELPIEKRTSDAAEIIKNRAAIAAEAAAKAAAAANGTSVGLGVGVVPSPNPPAPPPVVPEIKLNFKPVVEQLQQQQNSSNTSPGVVSCTPSRSSMISVPSEQGLQQNYKRPAESCERQENGLFDFNNIQQNTTAPLASTTNTAGGSDLLGSLLAEADLGLGLGSSASAGVLGGAGGSAAVSEGQQGQLAQHPSPKKRKFSRSSPFPEIQELDWEQV